jgi:hypothetical protein
MSDQEVSSSGLPADSVASWWQDLHVLLTKLTPGEKLQLIEEVARSLRQPSEKVGARESRTDLDRLRRELAALPVCNPADGFTNRNHDEELYGGLK